MDRRGLVRARKHDTKSGTGAPLRGDFFLVRPPRFKGVVQLSSRWEGLKVKFLTGFVVAMYLLGAVGSGVIHYYGHPEQSLFDALAHGLAWPGVLVEMARHPSF